jgi:MFS family permease
MLTERHGMPTWERPVPYGYPETIQSAGMVVAPLLAGFTITLIGLVVDTSNQGIRYRDTALLILAGAVAALLTAVQCAYAARQFMVTPDEIEAWWPGVTNAADPNEVTQWWELRAEQFAHQKIQSR